MAQLYHCLLLLLGSALTSRADNQGTYDHLVSAKVLAFVSYGSGPGRFDIAVYEGPGNKDDDIFHSSNQ